MLIKIRGGGGRGSILADLRELDQSQIARACSVFDESTMRAHLSVPMKRVLARAHFAPLFFANILHIALYTSLGGF